VPGFTKEERAHAHGGEHLGGKLPVGGSGGGAEEIRWGGAMDGCGSVRVGPTKRDLGVGKQMADGAHGSDRAANSARRTESFTVGLPQRGAVSLWGTMAGRARGTASCATKEGAAGASNEAHAGSRRVGPGLSGLKQGGRDWDCFIWCRACTPSGFVN
jgi:hypothetical protein